MLFQRILLLRASNKLDGMCHKKEGYIYVTCLSHGYE